MPMTSKQMIRFLKKNGFVIKSQNGSHVKMIHKKTGIEVIVPMHNGDLKKGMEHGILKQAGLDKKEVRKYE